MEVLNIDYVPGREIDKNLGIVKGQIVQSRHIGRDIMAELKNIVGGEIVSYTKMIDMAREKATERMIAEGEKLKADAIINVRYGTSAVTQGASEIFVYGTAVTLKK